MSGGWGTGWGLTPWGGFFLPQGFTPPPDPPVGFDLFCYFDDHSSMGQILVSPSVTYQDAGGQFTIEGNDLRVLGGGPTMPTDDAFLVVTAIVPASWTLQAIATFTTLPSDFSDIVHSHVYFGGQNATGFSGGLFVSQAGLAYTGAVHLSGGGDLVLNGPLQVIPGTASLIQEATSYTFRIAVDAVTSSTYIFATKSSDLPFIGHQLVAILPSIPTAGLVVDGAQLSVRGTAVKLISVLYDQLCMGTGLVMPNLPPRADAGRDQSLRTCTLGRLDGTASFDPEGGAITYSWRMIDAPLTSSYSFEGSDGFTIPQVVPDGTAFKFYSAALGTEDLADPLAVGDVLLFGGLPYSIIGTGVDGSGFYVELADNVLADNLVNIFFKLLRQRALTNPTSATPSFFPDVPGIYRFDLVVFDGQYLSSPAVTIINVLESSVPRGIVPDLGFVWQHMSDFWKLIEDRERIQTLWEGMAQVAAAELMTLWQVDYSKSLRDIQRTFQRRWLHYDLKLPEPLPALTTLRTIYYGLSSTTLAASGITGIGNGVLEITAPVHDPIRVSFPVADPYTPAAIASRIRLVLQAKEPRYTVTVIAVPGGTFRIRIHAPFLFAIGEATTLSLYTVGAMNGFPGGGAGQRLASRTYKVDYSLDGLGIVEGDLLVVGGEAYKISRVTDDPTDDYRFQRIITATDLPLLPGAVWSLPGQVTSRLLNFYNGMVSAADTAVFEVSSGASVTLVPVPVAGACQQAPGVLGVGTTPFVLASASVDPTQVRLAYVVRRTHLPIGELVQDVPGLQENIAETDDSKQLRRNVDYFIEPFRGANSLRFVSGNAGDPGDVWEGEIPPDRLWAEVTYLDNRPTIEANFGIPAGFTLDQLAELDSDLDYLSAVRGLWYSLINGPTMFNLRVGTQILLGLPYAEESGTIEEIRTDFSPTQGRILMRDSANTAVIRSYSFPSSLPLEINPTTKATYVVGDTVEQFAPLVQGAEVIDYVKDPKWFQGILNQGVFFEVEKFHKFMVRVDSAAFNLSALMFVRDFILRVKPNYVFPMFIVRAQVGDTEVSVDDETSYAATLILNDGACFNGNMGESTMFDDFRSAGGGSRNQFDADFNPNNAAPVYPTSQNVTWGYDKNYLCPEDEITFSYCLTHPGGVVPFDGGFQFDATNSPSHHFTGTGIVAVPAGPGGYSFAGTSNVTVTGSIQQLRLVVSGTLGVGNLGNYEIVIEKNSVDSLTVPVTITPSGVILQVAAVLAVTSGDTIECRIRPASGGARAPVWSYVAVTLFQTPIAFEFDDGIPAGDYCFTRVA